MRSPTVDHPAPALPLELPFVGILVEREVRERLRLRRAFGGPATNEASAPSSPTADEGPRIGGRQR